MDPDAATRATLNNVDLIAQWSGLEGARDDASTVRGSLFRLCGLHGAEPPRILAVLSEADVTHLLTQWRIPQAAPAAATPPTMAQLGQAGLFFRTCKQVCDMLPEQIAAALPAPAAGAPAPAAVGSRKVKMAHVINQVDDDEVEPMDATAVTAAYRSYKQQLGGFPPDDEELSAEQLTSLNALFRSGRAPYTDMAVWGPFQLRLQKKIKLKGMRFSSNGDMIPIELFGPADFSSWRECYMVFRTGAIMLEQITPSKLDGYEKIIRHYNDRYGKACWPIVYQADVRARMEQVERVRRRGQEAFDRARLAGLNHDFNPLQPWEWVWQELANDNTFWYKEIVEPAMLYLAKMANMSQLVDDDAKVTAPNASAPSSSTATRPPASTTSRPPKRQRGPDVREHKLGDDGMYTHNRRGAELCKMFQTGECKDKDQFGNCGRNAARKHQCAKCLSELHGANQCPMDAPKPPRQLHGKGKGKSRRK